MNNNKISCSPYAIRIYKEYFNFSVAHFVIFPNGEREPLHGHNYKVKVKANAHSLVGDMVFDFLDIKPLLKILCDGLDHHFIYPEKNPDLKLISQGPNWNILTPQEEIFSFPKKDVLILPIENTSAEHFAIYLTHRLQDVVWEKYHFSFSSIEMEVEETSGQSALYRYSKEEQY